MAEIVTSSYQEQVYEFVRTGDGSAVVIAVAGSGKTTTILGALHLIPPDQTARLFAFNAAIAAELRTKTAHLRHVTASTFHACGYRALLNYFGLKGIEVNSGKLRGLYRTEFEAVSFRERRMYESYVLKLTELAKGAGIGVLLPNEDEHWQGIIDHHDLTLDDAKADEELALRMAQDLLDASNKAAENYQIDFHDQLYLPILWDLPLDRTDWVFVDEAQDTNAIRRAMIEKALKKHTGRLIAVGDPKQAIYAFTGASTDAIDLIKTRWNCQELPLSVSYRCPRAIVRQAQSVVPYIEPAPSAPEGEVGTLDKAEVLRRLTPADVVLCRNNAPLVELAYECLSQGISCQILGRDIGKGLQALVTKMGAEAIDDREDGTRFVPGLLTKLAEYRTREMTRLLDKDQPAKAQSVDDRVQCLFTLIHNLNENERTLSGLSTVLQRLFSDEIESKLTLSTVHKAKGREWPQVGILRPDLMPCAWARQDWELEQEHNLQYVAWTRARAALYFIRS